MSPFRWPLWAPSSSSLTGYGNRWHGGEPIDVFGLLRPFVLGLCIIFFDVLVLGTINGIFNPIVEGTSAMLHDQQFSVREYQKEKDKLESDANLHNILSGGMYTSNEEFDKIIRNFG